MDVGKILARSNKELVSDIEQDKPVDKKTTVLSNPREVFERPFEELTNLTQSAKPERHPSSERFHQLLKEIGELHDKKQKDYGTPEDPFANVRGATEFGLPAPMGAFLAMKDCMQKITALVRNGRLENEPVDNVLKDMAVFSLIGLVLYEEENGREK
jgi:hypothetical protein